VVLLGTAPTFVATRAPGPTPVPRHLALVADDQSHAIVPPNNPYANVANLVPFNCDLYAIDNSPDCIYSSLLNINYARSLEGVGPMVLPSNYVDLPPAQQLFVIFNLERTSRGLPAFVELDASADADALNGALGSTDPAAPGSSTFQAGPSIAAFGIGNALQADWEWMYTDGCYPYVGNAGCTSTSPTDPAGWNHRDAILGNYGGAPVAGAAEATATSGPYPGSLTWTAEFGEPLADIPNGATAFLNSSVSYPSGAPPHLVRLDPSAGGVGSTITIEGVYLSGATAVDFNGAGCEASPSVTSDETATVVIPPCASGAVSLQVFVSPNTSNALAYDAAGPIVAAASGSALRPPFVGMASTPSGSGYWEVGSDGGVFTFGGAAFHGSTGGQHLNAPIVGMAATTDGGGYWLVGADGGVFAFGDAGFYGSAGNLRLAKPVVGIAPTSDGKGYWLVASDGGVFAYGDARFYGSMGGKPLNQPVVGMAPDQATGGYWLVAADGGIFSFMAPFDGSTGNIHLSQPVVGMEAAPNGSGYRLVASDGGLFSFQLPFEGSAASFPLAQPVVGMAAQGATGYWMVARDGGIFTFGGAGFFGSEG
jgi:IPT/TIG domain